jgi:hypothetical protein
MLNDALRHKPRLGDALRGAAAGILRALIRAPFVLISIFNGQYFPHPISDWSAQVLLKAKV